MLLSGQESVQTSRVNNLKLIAPDISYQITNRTDQTPTVISWGESVLIGLYDTSLFAPNDNISIFGDSTIFWKVYSVEDHWILVSFYDTTATTNFMDYMNEQNPTSVTDYKIITTIATTEYIRKIELHHNYKNLSVEMKALDTLNEYIDFGEMYMIADDTGNAVVYNLSLSFFNNIEEKNIDNVLFDLCISGEEYKPIIRGLTFLEKSKDLNYLTFTYNTNFGKQYIIFTTNSTLSSFAVYPDIHMTENLYNNVSNDIRVPALYMNMMNDIYATELIDLYAHDAGVLNANIPVTTMTKEIFEGDILYGNNVNYTVLSYDNYDTQVRVLENILGDITSRVDITNPGGIRAVYTYDGTGTALQCNRYLNAGSLITITSTNLNAANCGRFIVTDFGADWFEVDNAGVVPEADKIIDVAGSIVYTNVYILSYDEKIFLMSDNEFGAREQNLTNILLDFDVTTAADYTARILQIYYADTANAGADKELLYMTYFPAMTFYDSVAKTFRIII